MFNKVRADGGRGYGWLLMVLALAGCGGCEALSSRASRNGGSIPYAEEIRAESLAVLASGDTTYQRRMWQFRQRAAGIDTDSLRLLYIELGTAPDSAAMSVRHRYDCYVTAGLVKHGDAFRAAELRLVDSLKRAGDLYPSVRRRFARFDRNDPGIGRRTCGAFPSPIHDTLRFRPLPTAREAVRRQRKADSDSAKARTPAP